MARKKRSNKLPFVGLIIKIIPIGFLILVGLYIAKYKYAIELVDKIKLEGMSGLIVGYVLVFIGCLNILLILFGAMRKK